MPSCATREVDRGGRGGARRRQVGEQLGVARAAPAAVAAACPRRLFGLAAALLLLDEHLELAVDLVEQLLLLGVGGLDLGPLCLDPLLLGRRVGPCRLGLGLLAGQVLLGSGELVEQVGVAAGLLRGVVAPREQVLGVAVVERVERATLHGTLVDGRGAQCDQALDASDLGAGLVDPGLRGVDGRLRLVEAELGAVELLGELTDPLTVRLDLVLQRGRFGALVVDRRGLPPSAPSVASATTVSATTPATRAKPSHSATVRHDGMQAPAGHDKES